MKAFLRALLVSLLWSGVRRKVASEHPYVITVSGSVGKTSSKEAIADVLAASGRPVVRTHGNLGTDTGVPLSLFGFHEPPDGLIEWLSAFMLAIFPPIKRYEQRPYYVLEYSADKPGDIRFLAEKLAFQGVALTRIVPTHMAYYPDFDALVAEETSLVAHLPKDGYLVANADDPAQSETVKSAANACLYGIADSAPKKPGVWAYDIRLTEAGIRCSIGFVSKPAMDGVGSKGNQVLQVQTRLTGRHQLYPLLAAAAVGHREGISPQAMLPALEAFEAPSGRGKLIPGHKDIVIIDETYNASPEAVKAGLDMLSAMPGSRRKVAILGRMNELGDLAEAAHREIGAYAADKVDFLVPVGQYAEQVAAAAKEAGLPGVRILPFSSTERLLDKLEQTVQAHDLVYVKGSQNGVRLERVVKALMAHPENADTLLVRQSSYWKARA